MANADAAVPIKQIAALHQGAVDYVARATGLSLDGSEESLAIVDHYLEKVRTGGSQAVKPDVLRLIAAALGVYLGELITTRFGGSWWIVDAEPVDQSDMGALASWRVAIEAAPLLVDPIGMAVEALLLDAKEQAETELAAEESAPGFTLQKGAASLAAPLHDALARLAPVSSEYYYSLTGRFETLTYVVDLISDLRQKQDAPRDVEPEVDALSDDDRQEAAAPEPPRRQ